VALGKKKIDFLEDFDTIIVGGPIYMGRLEPIVADFCRDNVEILAHKKL
jgi:menaquinone-dependent protoporphyrinogen IX oxidase